MQEKLSKINKKKAFFWSLPIIFIILLIVILSVREENVPTHLSAETRSDSEIKLTWDGDERAVQFNIYRSENPDGPFGRSVGFSTKEEYLDKGLDPSTEYYYRVTQTINITESSFSSVASAITAPKPPEGLRGERVSFHKNLEPRVDLFWDYSVGKEKYVIYRTDYEGGIYEEIGRSVNENYSDRDVVPGKRYFYAITQIANDEESDYSKEVSVITDSAWECGDLIKYGKEEYNTLRIADQCWIQENLNIEEGETDIDCQVKRYCYQDSIGNCNRYGGLYDIRSAFCGQEGEGVQGICPLGWRIPTDEDWVVLETEIGLNERYAKDYGFRGSDEGSKLSGNYDFWKEGDLKENNLFGDLGFDALPSGYQLGHSLGTFRGMGEDGFFWSSTSAHGDAQCGIARAAYATREINYNETGIRRNCRDARGTASVRCVRDY